MPPLLNHAKLTGFNTGGPTAGALKQFLVDNSVPDDALLFIGEGEDMPQRGRPTLRPEGWIITARW